MSTPTADIIDLLAGIAANDPLAAVRDQRAQARENAQRSFEALLEPSAPGTFALAERYAVASFVSQLHGFAEATAFYGDLLGDEAPALIAVVADAATDAAATGPFGAYREPNLQDESTDGVRWAADAETAAALGPRLSAGLAHTHLLVFRPREVRAEALQALVDAGWSPDDIVSLSQLVAFLSFQLRVAWGLRVLAAASAPLATSAASATVSEGA
ncbi:hypothetical protein GCM10023065_05200 [Microbacterium laevaniformans]|uniref:CMD domain protein n=1 Tax=Microbacterium laevaniformans TaxID=36807 RepID=UPI001959CAA8|nr:CMD domain protein [Microbacterium laevaniformans]MBM7751473.1 CMD domain protein [Microbacterium laevaniformans]GLJ63634.1 hypothetical protein GCM10017578_05210 [Microbacterium laevaniformans]